MFIVIKQIVLKSFEPKQNHIEFNNVKPQRLATMFNENTAKKTFHFKFIFIWIRFYLLFLDITKQCNLIHMYILKGHHSVVLFDINDIWALSNFK